MRSMDISRFTDPRFGPDPYFEKLKDRASCSDMHLKYMFQIVWPLMDTFRKVLVGQRDMTTYLSIGRFAVGDRDFRSDGSVRLGFGHIYFWERPGTGKSLLAKTPSLVLGGTSSRFQGMAGTLPQDYTGNRIIQIDPQTEKKIFELVPGPGFTQMQLLDEFFRSDERTQGAALESLGEGTVTVAGTTYDKHPVTGEPISPFAIITGNPIETKGVYPAIRAFLDRIMFTVRGHEFSAHEFAEILRRTNQFHNVLVISKNLPMNSVDLLSSGEFQEEEFVIGREPPKFWQLSGIETMLHWMMSAKYCYRFYVIVLCSPLMFCGYSPIYGRSVTR